MEVIHWIEVCLDNLQPLPMRRRAMNLLLTRLAVLLHHIYNDPDGEEIFTNALSTLRKIRHVPPDIPDQPEEIIRYINKIEDEELKLRTTAFIAMTTEVTGQLLQQIQQQRKE